MCGSVRSTFFSLFLFSDKVVVVVVVFAVDSPLSVESVLLFLLSVIRQYQSAHPAAPVLVCSYYCNNK